MLFLRTWERLDICNKDPCRQGPGLESIDQSCGETIVKSDVAKIDGSVRPRAPRSTVMVTVLTVRYKAVNDAA